MKRFFQRRSEGGGSANFPSSPPLNNASFAAATADADASFIVSMPSRKQRMQLLRSIIHHADAVQKQFLVQKRVAQDDIKSPSKSNIFGNDDSITQAFYL